MLTIFQEFNVKTVFGWSDIIAPNALVCRMINLFIMGQNMLSYVVPVYGCVKKTPNCGRTTHWNEYLSTSSRLLNKKQEDAP